MDDRGRAVTPRQLTEKEEALLRDHYDRQERYLRTARFVQSKWFMIIATVALTIFLIVMFLIAG